MEGRTKSAQQELDSLYLKARSNLDKSHRENLPLHDMQVFGEENPYADGEQVVNAVYKKSRENGLTGWRGEIRWIICCPVTAELQSHSDRA